MYNPMYNPYGLNQPLMQNYAAQTVGVQMPAPQMEIPKVTGEESARAFAIGPNSSVILLDTVNPLIWVVTTDASGYKTVTPYSITPYTPEQPLDAADVRGQLTGLNERLDKLEERMNNRGQSNHGSSWKNKSGNERNQSNDSNAEGGN